LTFITITDTIITDSDRQREGVRAASPVFLARADALLGRRARPDGFPESRQVSLLSHSPNRNIMAKGRDICRDRFFKQIVLQFAA
jgi:hypothetical protein